MFWWEDVVVFSRVTIRCLVHLTRLGLKPVCYAPNKAQMHTVDHVTGEPNEKDRWEYKLLNDDLILGVYIYIEFNLFIQVVHFFLSFKQNIEYKVTFTGPCHLCDLVDGVDECSIVKLPRYFLISLLYSNAGQLRSRNVLSESARIARGKVQPLADLKAADVDAVVFPGGFGVAKNLWVLFSGGDYFPLLSNQIGGIFSYYYLVNVKNFTKFSDYSAVQVHIRCGRRQLHCRSGRREDN